MTDILTGVLKSGTAKGLKWSSASDIEAAGKTGTTNSNKVRLVLWLYSISYHFCLCGI